LAIPTRPALPLHDALPILGQRISVAMDAKNPFGEIIGVVGNVKEGALDKEPTPTVYYIHAHLIYTGMVFVVRAKSDPLSLADPVDRKSTRLNSSHGSISYA